MRLAFLLLLLVAAPLAAQSPAPLPPLPDSTGWGVHVLAARQDRDGGVWVGTYGQGIFRLPRDSAHWERIRSDTTRTSISRERACPHPYRATLRSVPFSLASASRPAPR